MRSRFGTTFACRLMCSNRPELNLAMTFQRAQRTDENRRCRSARPTMQGAKLELQSSSTWRVKTRWAVVT